MSTQEVHLTKEQCEIIVEACTWINKCYEQGIIDIPAEDKITLVYISTLFQGLTQADNVTVRGEYDV